MRSATVVLNSTTVELRQMQLPHFTEFGATRRSECNPQSGSAVAKLIDPLVVKSHIGERISRFHLHKSNISN